MRPNNTGAQNSRFFSDSPYELAWFARIGFSPVVCVCLIYHWRLHKLIYPQQVTGAGPSQREDHVTIYLLSVFQTSTIAGQYNVIKI